MTALVDTEPKLESPVGAPGAVATVAAARKGRGEFLYFALRSKKFLLAMGILLVLIAIAVLGPMIDGTDPVATDLLPMQPPSTDPGYWLGTTSFGEDVFAQFANGLRATFFVGLLGGGLAALIGMAVGFTAGYRGGWTDEIVVCDMESSDATVEVSIPTDWPRTSADRDLVLSQGQRRSVRSRVHWNDFVAVGGARDPGPNLLIAVQGLHRPGQTER